MVSSFVALVLVLVHVSAPAPVAAPWAPGNPALEADALARSGQWKAAAEAYRRALAADPADGVSAEALGTALFRQGEWSTSAEAFARAAAISPVVRADALYGLACARAHRGETAAALQALEQALDAGYLATRTLASDHDLDPLRAEPGFLALCRRVFGPEFGSAPSAGPPTAAEMSAGIQRLVATILERHPDPFRLLSRTEWNARAAAAVARVADLDENMDEAGYAVELIRLACAAGDVHTSAYPGPDCAVMQRALPVAFWKFPDGLRIRAARPEHAELLGAQVLAFGAQACAELWPRLVREFPFENEWMAAGALAFLLRFPDFLRGLGLESTAESATLRLRLVGGEERTVTLTALRRGYGLESEETRDLNVPAGWASAAAEPPPLWMQKRSTNYWLTHLVESGTLYLQLNLPRDDPARPWATFLDELVATALRTHPERLVIDLRHNRGGWGYMGQDLVWRLRELPELNRPGHLFVLIGRVTQSAGVVIACALERQAHAVFVGEPLAAHPNFCNGRRGNHPPLVLPGTGLLFRVSEVEEQNSDPLDSRRFLAPDLPVALTWDDFAGGRDPVLEAALDIAPERAARLLDDAGGRPLEPYFRWQRPSQHWAFGRAEEHPVP